MTAAERKRLYRRRRIVFFSALAVVLALAVFTVYSLVRGAVSVHGMAGASAAPALSRAEVPAAPQRSKVETCTPGDVDVQLVPDATSVGVGGSLDFTERVAYVGKSPEGCRMNTAADSLVLTITSGSDVIWRSDVCEAAYRPRLFFADVTDEQKIAWNTNGHLLCGRRPVAEGRSRHVCGPAQPQGRPEGAEQTADDHRGVDTAEFGYFVQIGTCDTPGTVRGNIICVFELSLLNYCLCV